jgi:uncharacterized membrane protein (DUF485 family)
LQGAQVSPDLAHAVEFLQAAYTILLALAFQEAFQQLVPDSDLNIRWERFPSLLAFLFMIFPFFHGMMRYFYITYLEEPQRELPSVAGSLMFDGIMFFLMAAAFFSISHSLSPSRWVRFYVALGVLLVFDSIWIAVSLYRGAHLCPWLILNGVLAFILMTIYAFRDKIAFEVPIEHMPRRLGPWLAPAATFSTTVADYVWMRHFYFD